MKTKNTILTTITAGAFVALAGCGDTPSDGDSSSVPAGPSAVKNSFAEVSAKLDPTASSLQVIHERVRAEPKRVIFAADEKEVTIRAALSYRNIGYGTPVLIGREIRSETPSPGSV